jgi:hypothetical protein
MNGGVLPQCSVTTKHILRQVLCIPDTLPTKTNIIQVLDFGASRDGIPASKRGRRIVVDADGYEVTNDDDDEAAYLEMMAEDGADS